MCMFTENQRVLLHSEEYFDQLNTTQHTNENKMKKFELKAIKANMKYKNNSDDIQNFEEYKNVSQKLFHEIVSIESTLFRFLEYLVDLEGEVLYQTVQYEKGLSKEKRRETNLDYYKEEADYYGKL
ncbi:hypothetical protein KSF78_0004575 [Schistosoma japonicum]|nr:hypothetical protein KSF78_0004575 [Schistosoma japonicum]